MVLTDESLVVISFTIMDFIRFICFFLICYFFCKRATNILPAKRKWLIFLNIFLVLNLAFMITSFIFLEVTRDLTGIQSNLLCKSIFFITMSGGGEIITIVFAIIGFIITLKVREQERITKYEQT